MRHFLAEWKTIVALIMVAPGAGAAEPFACLLGASASRCMTEADPLFDLEAARGRQQWAAGAVNRLRAGGNAKLYLSPNRRYLPPYRILTRNGELAVSGRVASAFLVPQACFYAQPKSAGPAQCREPGSPLALTAGSGGKIASISIPQGLRVYASGRDPARGSTVFNPPGADLVVPARRDLRQFDVARTRIGCHRECPLGETDSYAIDAIYGELWNHAFFDIKTFQFTFSIRTTSWMEITLAGRFRLRFSLDRGRLGRGHGSLSPAVGQPLALDPATRFLTLAFEREGERALRYQVLELGADRQLLRASPLAELFNGKKPDGVVPETFTILSHSPDVRLASLSFAVGTGPKRAYRSYGLALCYANPLLAIFNYVVQGKCNQPEAIYRYVKGDMPPRNAMLLHVAGDFSPPGRSNHVQPVIPLLTRTRELFTDRQNPFLLYGTSRACGTTVERILMPRLIMRRGLGGDPAACAYWTLDILTVFHRVYGDRWDTAFFNDVIDRIIRHGTVEQHTGMNPADIARLIERVQNLHATQREQLDQIRHGYGRATSLFYSSSYGRLIPDDFPSGNVTSQFQPIVVTANAPASIGRYELDVTRFTPLPDSPRLWQQGSWGDAPADFRVLVFDAHSQHDLDYREVILTLGEWLTAYGTAGRALNDSGREEGAVAGLRPGTETYPLARWGGSLTSNLLLEMRSPLPPGSVLVAVYYQGRLASVVLGSLNGGRATVEYVLSRPDSVLPPYTADSVRGAGRRALTEFIRLCMARGVRTLVAHAITPPSASLHAGLGFRLQGDL